MSSIHGRRSFVSALASIAGLAGLEAAGEPTAAQTPTRPNSEWDLSWLDQLKAKHKQVFDYGSFDISADLRPLRYVRNYLDPYRDVFGLAFPDVNTAVGIARAFPINASDALWAKYRLGERWKINDPATKLPAVRNIFLNDGDAEVTVKALQARGTIFWQCNVALSAIAQELAQATQASGQEVRAELVAGLNPGVRLVPSHMLALGMAQERGFTYVKA
jgi:hypothetical protein